MKKCIQLLALCFVCFCFSGCLINQFLVQGSGNVVTQTRDVADFDKVKLIGSPDVSIKAGDEFSVKVTTDDNLQANITTEVKNGALVVGSQGMYSTNSGVKIAITMPELVEAKVSGSGDLEFDGFQSESFTASISGSGSIKGSGSAKTLSAKISGSGDIELGKFETEATTVSISGSGDVEVNATKSLDAKISGSGDIKYVSHDDLKVSKKIAGSGDVSAK